MAAIVTGAGAGIYNTSLNLLGSAQGDPRLGRFGDNVYINSATGNLVIQQQDEFLSGTGLNTQLIRTYNSQGQWSDNGWDGDNSDNWRLNVYQRLSSVIGGNGVNTAGSSLTKTYGDGHVATFIYDTNLQVYTTPDGQGANDSLQYNTVTQQWTFTDGSPDVVEIYDNQGQLTATRDAHGNGYTYIYSNGLITQITDIQSGSITDLTYGGSNGTNLQSITTTVAGYRVQANEDWADIANTLYNDPAAAEELQAHYGNPQLQVGLVLSGIPASLTESGPVNTGATYTVVGNPQISDTKVSYTYDAQNRLETVTVDLSPEDSDTSDGNAYVTTYTYRDTSSHFIQSITTQEGSNTAPVKISFTYDGQDRIKDYTDGVGNTTTISYTNNSGGTPQSDPLDPTAPNVSNQGYTTQPYYLNTPAAVNYDAALHGNAYDTRLTPQDVPVDLIPGVVTTPTGGAGGWASTPTDLGSVDGTDESGRSGFDAAGNGIVVWEQGGNIYARHYDAVQGVWQSTTVPLETLGASMRSPNISVASSGHAAVSWRENAWMGTVYVARFIPGSGLGTGWQAPEPVTNYAEDWDVDVDNQGRVVVSMKHYDGSRFNAAAATFDGSSWTTQLALDTGNANVQFTQAVTAGNGEHWVMWMQQDNGVNSVYASQYVPGSGWQPEQLLETTTAPVAFIREGFDDAGNGFVLWRENGTDLIAARYDGSSWTRQAIGLSSSANIQELDVQVDSSGTAIATWTQNNASGVTTIWVNRYDATNGGWQGPEPIDSPTGATLTFSYASIDAQGRAAVTWQRIESGQYNIYVSNFDINQNVWSGAVSLENIGPVTDSYHLAADGQGGFHAFWNQWSGSSFQLRTSAYVPPSNGTPYYTVTATDTWDDVALSLYNDIRVSDELAQHYLDNYGYTQPQDAPGLQLLSPPDPIMDIGRLMPSAENYYVLQGGETWNDIAFNAYGDANLGDELETFYGTSTPAAAAVNGELLNVPAQLSDTNYQVQAGDSWTDIANHFYGPNADGLTDEVQAHYFGTYGYTQPQDATNGILLAPPAQLDDDEAPDIVADYYTATGGESWADIALSVYTATAAEAALALSQYQTNSSLTPPLLAGSRVELPPTLNYVPGSSGNSYVDVTDALGNSTRFEYDAQQRLMATVDDLGNRTAYSYHVGSDNIHTVTDTNNQTTTFSYDARGNLTQRTDDTNTTVDYVYDSNNRLVTETIYTDADGQGPAPATPATSRYVYDSAGKLIFSISAQGRVNELVYNALGQVTTSISYTGATFALPNETTAQTLANLTQTDVLTESQLTTWTQTQALDTTQRTETTYDIRGQVHSIKNYASVDSAGTGQNPNTNYFIYDHYGQLIQSIDGNGQATQYTYDGLGRLVSSVDALNHITTSLYDDANNQVKLTQANGLLTTSTYDARGLLLNQTQTATAQSTLQTATAQAGSLQTTQTVNTGPDVPLNTASPLVQTVRDIINPQNHSLLNTNPYLLNTTAPNVSNQGYTTQPYYLNTPAAVNYDAALHGNAYDTRLTPQDVPVDLIPGVVTTPTGGAGGWASTPTDLGSVDGTDESGRSGFDAAGNGIVVWEQGGNIYARHYDAVQGVWQSTTVPLETLGASMRSPNISVASSGHAAVSWRENAWMGTVYVARFIPGSGLGTGWQAPEPVTNYAEDWDVDVDNQGRVVVSMKHYDGSRFNAAAATFDGSSWTTQLALDTGNANVQFTQAVTAGNGEHWVMWMQQDNGVNSVYASQYVPGSGWQPEQLLETTTAPVAFIREGFDDAGNGFVLWRENGTDLIAARYDGSSWTRQAIGLSSSANIQELDVQVDSSGTAIATWTQNNASGVTTIWVNRYDATNGGWQGPEPIDSPTGATLTFSYASIDAQGRAAVTWQRIESGQYNIYVSNFDINQNVWSGAVSLENIGPVTDSYHLAADGQGGFHAFWNQWSGSSFQLRTSAYVPPSNGTPYYTVTATDTWDDVALSLYNDIRVSDELAQHYLDNYGYTQPQDAPGLQLLSPPDPIMDIGRLMPSAENYYVLQGGETWNDIAFNAYGDANLGDELETFYGTSTPAAAAVNGELLNVPAQLSDTNYQVQTTDTWTDIANHFYGPNADGLTDEVQAHYFGTYGYTQPQDATNGILLAPPAQLDDDEHPDPNPIPAYYTVQAGDTWDSIAFSLYGNAAVADELQTHYAQPQYNITTLTAGITLDALPAQFTDVDYLIRQGDSWASIAQALYNTQNVADELQAHYAQPQYNITTLIPDTVLPAIPGNLWDDEATSPQPVDEYYVVQSTDTWASIAGALYNDSNLGDELQAAFNTNNTDVVSFAALTNNELQGLPLQLQDASQTKTITITPYYSVSATDLAAPDVWASIATNVYGDANAASALQSYFAGLGITTADLQSTTQLETPATLAYWTTTSLVQVGSSANTYDAAGRLRSSTDANGHNTYFIYDTANRLTGLVDARGYLTQSVYDSAGNVVQTIAYATPLSAADISNLNDVTGQLQLSNKNITLADITITVDALNDRNTYTLYDKANRAVMSLTPHDTNANDVYVTQLFYDAAGRVTDTVQYGNAVDTSSLTVPWQVDEIELLITSAPTLDRHTRTFYSDDGQVLAQLDGEGYLTESIYDIAGRRTSTIKYATQILNTPAQPNLLSTGDLATLRSTANTVPADNRQAYTLYNGRNQVVAKIDADGYLTTYQYDAAGNQTDTRRYDTAVTYTGQSVSTLQGLAGSAIAETVTQYDALNRVSVRTDFISGTQTQYSYDTVGHLIQTDVAVNNASETRTEQSRYDQKGRLIASLSGEGSDQITQRLTTLLTNNPAATPAEQAAVVDSVWAEYATTYSYDNADRLLSTRGANGQTRWYYYDDSNNVQAVISAADGGTDVNGNPITQQGEVTLTNYNGFGQVIDTTRLSNRIDTTSLTGGDISAIQTVLSGLTNAAVDSTSTVNYTLRGAVKQAIDAQFYKTENSYNAFGERESVTTQLSSPAASLATAQALTLDNQNSVQSHYTYTQRGEAYQTVHDVNGLAQTRLVIHDAFGRVKTVYQNGVITQQNQYSVNAGRQVTTTTDAVGYSNQIIYDALGRQTRLVDANGNTTTLSYDDANRTVTMTTSEGITTTTHSNRHGETTQVDDGNGNVTQYTYDKNGNLNTVTEDVNGQAIVSANNTYDQSNRVIQTEDANGNLVITEYDAANRVIKQIIDPITTANPNGLAIKTEMWYDGQGRVAVVKDARNVETHTAYDKRGQVNTITVDPITASNPNGLNIITAYTYDGRGKTLTVTEAQGTPSERITKYSYDKLGRREYEIVDPYDATTNPTGLDITTRYHYDNVDNLIAVTDANQNVTRYVYDANQRQTHVIDALGQVTQTVYDGNGNVLKTIAYHQTVTVSDLDTTTFTATLQSRVTTLQANNGNDGRNHVMRYAYDADNRLRFSIDSLGGLTETVYDDNNNVIQTTAYATPLSTAQLTTYDARIAEHTDVDVTNNSVLDNIIEGLRDTAGFMTAEDQTTHFIYDGLNRQRFSINSVNTVSETTYYANGQIKTTAVYNNPVDITADLSDTVTFATLTSWQAAELAKEVPGTATTAAINAAQVQSYYYDNAGRLEKSTDSINLSESYAYDDAGNKTAFTNKLGNTWTYQYDEAGRLTHELSPQVEVTRYNPTTQQLDTASQTRLTTFYTYDALGHVKTKTEGYNTPDARTVKYEYDDAGRQTKTIIDPSGMTLTTEVKYGAMGQVLQRIDANLNVTSYIYDSLYRETHSIDALGGISHMVYDTFGNVIHTRRYATALNSIDTAAIKADPSVIVSTLNGAATTYFSANDSLDVVTWFAYDNNNRLVYTVNGLNEVSITDYDAFGRAVKSTQVAQALNSGQAATFKTESANGTGYTYLTGQRSSLENNLNDRISYQVYDNANRLRFRVQQNAQPAYTGLTGNARLEGYVSEYRYDAHGNQIRSIDYATIIKSAELSALDATLDIATRSETGLANLSGLVLSTLSDGVTAVADGNERIHLNVFNAANQLRYSIDAMGYVTENAYDSVGELKSVWRFANNISTIGMDLSADPQILQLNIDFHGSTNPLVNTTEDQIDMYGYDTAGRLVWSRDAAGNREFYGYDAVGNKTWFTNKNGASASSGDLTLQGEAAKDDNYTWTYVYDAANRLTQEITPKVDVTRLDPTNPANSTTSNESIITLITYDNLGNVKTRTEAYGAPEERITSYDYDALGRQIKTTFPAVDVYHAGDDILNNYQGRNERVATLYSEVTYDALGNATANRDVAGHYNYKVYDSQGRIAFDIDAEQYITGYAYDAFGNQTTLTRYANAIADAIADPKDAAVANKTSTGYSLSEITNLVYGLNGLQDPNQDRIITTDYDALGRVVSTRQPAVYAFDSTQSNNTNNQQYFNVQRETRNVYNAFGDITTQSELQNPNTTLQGPTWANTQYKYNSVGQTIAQLDTLGYLTEWKYDAVGNVIKQIEYASKNNNFSTPIILKPADENSVSNVGFDREKRFTYDLLNRQTSETLFDVIYSTATFGGVVTPTNVKGNLTSRIEYDKLGNVISTSERADTYIDPNATGVTTYMYYDVLGRKIGSAEPFRFSDTTGSAILPALTASEFYFDVSGISYDRSGNDDGYGLVANTVNATAYIDMSWSDLNVWGTGASRVLTSYNYGDAGYPNPRTITTNLTDAEASHGARVTLQDPSNILGLTRVQVQKQLGGQWVNVFDSLNDTANKNILSWPVAAVTGTEVRIYFRPIDPANPYDATDPSSWDVTDGSWSQLNNLAIGGVNTLGGRYWVDMSTQLADQYEYKLVYTRPGETSYADGHGTFMLHHGATGSSSHVVGWVDDLWLDVGAIEHDTGGVDDGYGLVSGGINTGAYVDLSFSDLSVWGPGPSRVLTTYIDRVRNYDPSNNQLTYTDVPAYITTDLTEAEAAHGVRIDLNRNAKSISSIQVQKYLNGQWINIFNNANDVYQPARLLLRGNAGVLNGSGITITNAAGNPVGTGTYSVGNGGLVNLGNGLYAVALTGLAPGQYNYQAVSSGVGGTFTVDGIGGASQAQVVEHDAWLDISAVQHDLGGNNDGYGQVSSGINTGAYVDLSFSDLRVWGSGPSRVLTTYIDRVRNYDPSNNQLTYTDVPAYITTDLTEAEAAHGVRIDLNRNAKSISGIQVQKQLGGQWVTVLDSANDLYSERLEFTNLSGSAQNVSFSYRPAGSSDPYLTKPATRLGSGWFSTNYADIPVGQYDYQLTVDGSVVRTDTIDIKHGGQSLPTTSAGSSKQLTPLTTYQVDIFGNTVVSERHASGATLANSSKAIPDLSNSQLNILNYYFYNQNSLTTRVVDGEGNSIFYSYDESAQLVKEWQLRFDPDSQPIQDTTYYKYDNVGQQIEVSELTTNIVSTIPAALTASEFYFDVSGISYDRSGNDDGYGLVANTVNATAYIDMSWSDLNVWGTGASRVLTSYNYGDAGYPNPRTITTNLTDAEASHGARVTLQDPSNILGLTRVQVQKQLGGQWVNVFDSLNDTANKNILSWPVAAVTGTEVRIYFRPIDPANPYDATDPSSWDVTDGSWSQLNNLAIGGVNTLGGRYWVDMSTQLADQYEYKLVYTRPGETQSYADGHGTFMLHHGATGSSSHVVGWVDDLWLDVGAIEHDTGGVDDGYGLVSGGINTGAYVDLSFSDLSVWGPGPSRVLTTYIDRVRNYDPSNNQLTYTDVPAYITTDLTEAEAAHGVRIDLNRNAKSISSIQVQKYLNGQWINIFNNANDVYQPARLLLRGNAGQLTTSGVMIMDSTGSTVNTYSLGNGGLTHLGNGLYAVSLTGFAPGDYSYRATGGVVSGTFTVDGIGGASQAQVVERDAWLDISAVQHDLGGNNDGYGQVSSGINTGAYVDLSFSDLRVWGSGPSRVLTTYIDRVRNYDPSNNQLTYTDVPAYITTDLTEAEAAHGVRIDLNRNAKSISGIQVQKQLGGQWVTVLDSANDLYSERLEFTNLSGSAQNVSFSYRPAGSSDPYLTKPATRLGSGWFSTNYADIPVGQYDYQLTVDGTVVRTDTIDIKHGGQTLVGTASNVVKFNRSDVKYNAFGEISSKGENGTTHEYFDYDKNGNLWRTNQGDGVDRIYLYNLTGQVTRVIESDTNDLRSYSLQQAYSSQAATLQSGNRATDTIYDALGRIKQKLQPTFTQTPQTTQSIPAALTTSEFYFDVSGISYDRSGNDDGYGLVANTVNATAYIDMSWSDLNVWGNGRVARIDELQLR